MNKFRHAALLLVAPLLISCSGGEIDFNFDAPTIDVDSIAVPALTRDTLTGEIASEGDRVFFDLYEVSDFHGAVNYSVDEQTIGIARMGDYFRQKRLANPGGTIVLSSGDLYQGSAESNLTHGYIVNYSLNVMGFESITLGNHEFDWGLDWLKKNANLSVQDYKIPYLGANVYDKSTGKILDFLKPSVVISRGDYKIGIIGTMGDGANTAIMPSLVSNLDFKSEVPIVRAEAQRLIEEEGCNTIVWSSHRDVEELSSLGISSETGISVVFGGHSHTNSPAEGEEAKVVNGITFLETKAYGKGISHARITLNKTTKELVSVKGDTDTKPYVAAGLVEHPEVKKVLDTYNAYIDPIKSKVIGNTDAELDVSDTFSLTNLCVDTMAKAANKWGKDNNIKVVAAFHNANGGVRSNMAAGDITFGSVYKSFPFDNEICVVKTTGKKLKTYFSKANSYGVWHDTDVIKNLDSLEDKTEYYFTTTDFMGTASSFVFKLKDADLIRTGYIVRDAVAARIQSQKNIKQADFVRSNAQFQVPTK